MSSQYPQVTTRPMPRPAAPAMSPAVDRRARLVLRRLDPWSVLKFSVVFYFCLMLVSLLVFAVIWFGSLAASMSCRRDAATNRR